jgi:hypothetical protein
MFNHLSYLKYCFEYTKIISYDLFFIYKMNHNKIYSNFKIFLNKINDQT